MSLSHAHVSAMRYLENYVTQAVTQAITRQTAVI